MLCAGRVRCVLEAVERVLCLLFAGAAGGDALRAIGAGSCALCAGGAGGAGGRALCARKWHPKRTALLQLIQANGKAGFQLNPTKLCLCKSSYFVSPSCPSTFRASLPSHRYGGHTDHNSWSIIVRVERFYY